MTTSSVRKRSHLLTSLPNFESGLWSQVAVCITGWWLHLALPSSEAKGAKERHAEGMVSLHYTSLQGKRDRYSHQQSLGFFLCWRLRPQGSGFHHENALPWWWEMLMIILSIFLSHCMLMCNFQLDLRRFISTWESKGIVLSIWKLNLSLVLPESVAEWF